MLHQTQPHTPYIKSLSLLHGELAWILTQQGVLFSQGAIEKLDTEVDLVTGQTALHVLWHRNKLLFLDQR